MSSAVEAIDWLRLVIGRLPSQWVQVATLPSQLRLAHATVARRTKLKVHAAAVRLGTCLVVIEKTNNPCEET